MKFRDLSVLIAIGVAVVAGAVGYVSYYWLGPDNVIEEKCEDIIQNESGTHFDLSPATPEPSVLQENPKIVPPVAV